MSIFKIDKSEEMMDQVIEAYTGVTPAGKKSRTPAKLDRLLTGTGVILALFMIGHMFFVSSILLGKDAMYSITKMFELEFLFEGGIPAIVSVIVLGVVILFVIHATLGLRKFPSNYQTVISINIIQNILHLKPLHVRKCYYNTSLYAKDLHVRSKPE